MPHCLLRYLPIRIGIDNDRVTTETHLSGLMSMEDLILKTSTEMLPEPLKVNGMNSMSIYSQRAEQPNQRRLLRTYVRLD